MYIQLRMIDKKPQVELTPVNRSEERLLREYTNILYSKNLLIWWGDTEPLGKMLSGLKISFKDSPEEVEVITRCTVCGKDTNTGTGWHLKYGLDFCGNPCVAEYIETTLWEMTVKTTEHDQRIDDIEALLRVIRRGK